MRRGWSNSAQRAICKIQVNQYAQWLEETRKTDLLVSVSGDRVRVMAEETVEVHVLVFRTLGQLLDDSVDLSVKATSQSETYGKWKDRGRRRTGIEWTWSTNNSMALPCFCAEAARLP